VRTTLTSPRAVRRMVDDAASAGFNTLVVQVRGRGDAFYDSRWEPPGEQLLSPPSTFDPLALVIEEAHRRGLAVHAWVNTHLVWDAWGLPGSPEHMVRRHPDWLAVPRTLARQLFDVDPQDPRFVQALIDYAAQRSETVEGVYSSPAHPAVKERVYSVWTDLAERYDLDGIHLDYVRFPSGDFDYSRGALERFRAWVAPRLEVGRLTALDAAYQGDPLAFVDSLPEPWARFRRRQITDLVERLYYGVKARRPELVVSAAVFANQEDAYLNRFQDWGAWLDRGIIDVVAPMAYVTETDRFERYVANAVDAARDRERIWAGIGAYLNTAEGTIRQIDIARDRGAGGVILFSYDWAAWEAPTVDGRSYLRTVGEERFGR
jgi:uncharacterized lipoprotein YddW (UPF0748 family)